MSQVVHPHSRGDGDRRHLGDLHGPFAHNVATEYLVVMRSTISLQKPILRPSMIVRVVVSNRTVATTISCVSRAFDSVSPTWAYSGSVKLPIGTHRS